MKGWETKMDVISLYKKHGSIRKVSMLTGMSRNTVKRIINNTHAPLGNCKVRKKVIDPFCDYAALRYEEGFNARLIFEQIKKIGFTGSYDSVQRFVKTLVAKETVSKKTTIRFETEPGRQVLFLSLRS